MLYDFHRTENAKSPHSVNATYVITGIQKEEPGNGKAASTAANGTQENDNDDDEMMQSSPYISSSMPNQDSTSQAVGKASIILVREEDFDGIGTTKPLDDLCFWSLTHIQMQRPPFRRSRRCISTVCSRMFCRILMC